MARAKAAPKSPAKAPKKPAAKAPPPSGGGGSVMFKLLFYLAILGGVGYAATRVPVGGRTVAEHAAELVKWDSVRVKGAELSRAAGDAVKKATGEKAPAKATTQPQKAAPPAKTPPPPPVKPEKKPKATKVASAEAPPADTITKADRDALEQLLR